MSINKYVLRSTFVGALGGLLFGFDTANISGTIAALTQVFQLHNIDLHLPLLHGVSELGITVSMALFGTVIGALAAGTLGQRYGSREMLRLTAVLFLLSRSAVPSRPPGVFCCWPVSSGVLASAAPPFSGRSISPSSPQPICEDV